MIDLFNGKPEAKHEIDKLFIFCFLRQSVPAITVLVCSEALASVRKRTVRFRTISYHCLLIFVSTAKPPFWSRVPLMDSFGVTRYSSCMTCL